MSGINVIRRWVIQSRLKEQSKQGGVMITLPPKNFVDLNTSITADRLLRSGIDIDQLTSVAQVENLVNRINKLSTRVISQDDPRFKGIMNQLMGKKGEVVDMTGKKIPPGSKIMGGQAVEDQKRFFKGVEIKDPKFDENMPFDSDAEKLAEIKMSNEAYEQIPPGSRGGPEDIAAPVQSAEEATTNLMDSTIQKMLKMEPVNAMKEANKVIKREGIYKALDEKQAKKILEDTEDHIFERDPKPEEFQKGGIARIGLKDGMNRRTFLKFLGGAISLPIIGRFFKPTKGVSKVSKVPMIKTGDVPGKPEWFDQLVNRVIMEGDDVTKNFATKDREIVHMKKIDDETSVRVTQDLDEDTIMVDIDDPVRNVMGEQGDTTLMMRYKKGRADEETKGTPPDEFDVTEADMRNYMDGPDDYVTEFVDNTVTNTKDLTSDLTKIKSYATGKNPTMKEIAESKRRRDQVKFAEERPAEYAADRGPQYEYGDEDIELYTDYKKGGLAGMLGE